MKKSILLAGGFAVLATQGVMAADWDGLYGGISLSDYNYSTDNHDIGYYDMGGSITQRDTGSAIGVQVGMNMTRDSFLYGIELGYDSIDAESSNPYTNGDFLLTNEFSSSINLKLRAGITQERALFYVFAGLAETDEEHAVTDPDGSSSLTGVTAESERPMTIFGAGVEHLVTDAISVRAELVQGNGQKVTGISPLDPTAQMDFTGDVRLFTLGVNAHF